MPFTKHTKGHKIEPLIIDPWDSWDVTSLEGLEPPASSQPPRQAEPGSALTPAVTPKRGSPATVTGVPTNLNDQTGPPKPDVHTAMSDTSPPVDMPCPDSTSGGTPAENVTHHLPATRAPSSRNPTHSLQPQGSRPQSPPCPQSVPESPPLGSESPALAAQQPEQTPVAEVAPPEKSENMASSPPLTTNAEEKGAGSKGSGGGAGGGGRVELEGALQRIEAHIKVN